MAGALIWLVWEETHIQEVVGLNLSTDITDMIFLL